MTDDNTNQDQAQTDPNPSNPTVDATGQNSGTEARFTQADVDGLIAIRLQRERAAAADKVRKEREAAESAKALEQGEFQKLAEVRAAKIAELEASIAQRDLAELRRTVGTAYKLPEALSRRLSGETREELEADAKELAKLVAVSAEERTPSPGNVRGPNPVGIRGDRTPSEEAKAAALKTGRYPGF